MTDFAHLPIEKITVHPRNIRRDVTVDDELVASIRANGIVQALTVAPAGDGYVLVAGHRRLINAREAGLSTVPAMIRSDLVTDAQHIEAMAIENIQRSDLTPVEEADAYEQLQLIGYTQERISEATGRSVSTVASRMKLTKLPAPARDAVHVGQLTLTDAALVAELEEVPEIRDRLLEHVGTRDWTYQVSTARYQLDVARKRVATEARIAAGDAKKATKRQVENRWSLSVDYQVDGETGKKLTAKSHATCPGHRVYADPSDGVLRFLCVDASKYGHMREHEYRQREENVDGARDAEADLVKGILDAGEAREAFVVAHIRDHGAASASTVVLEAFTRCWFNSPWKPHDSDILDACVRLDLIDPDDPDTHLVDVVHDLEGDDANRALVLASLLGAIEDLQPRYNPRWLDRWASADAQLALGWLDQQGYPWTKDENAARTLLEQHLAARQDAA